MAEYLDCMVESAEELYTKRKTKQLVRGQTDADESSSEPLAKRVRTRGDDSDSSSSTDSSSPGTWSFSSGGEEDMTVDISTFIKNQRKKYDRVVSQVKRSMQISMSVALLMNARNTLSPSSNTSEWEYSTYGLPGPCKKKR